MDLFNQLSTWSSPCLVNDDVFYFISKRKIIEELPLFFNKEDTVYRNLVSLKKKGLIVLIKEKNKDLIRLTKLGKTWNEDFNI